MKKKGLIFVSALLASGLVLACCVVERQRDQIRTYSEQVTRLEDDKARLSNQVAYHKNVLEFTAPTEYGMSTMTVDDLVLLSKVVQLEAGDSYYKEAQQYMTKVILNRVVSPDFPDSVHDVVYQEGQFDVVQNLDTCELERDTVLNVFEVLCGDAAADLPGYVTYFYADYVKDDWVTTLPVYMTHEGTVYAYIEGSNVR